MAHLDLAELKARPLPELVTLARSKRIDQPSGLTRQQLIFELLRTEGASQTVLGGGVLEVLPDGFGFLRDSGGSFMPGADDIYVSPSQIRRFNLRNGDRVSGHVRPPKEGERYFALTRVEEVNGRDPERSRDKALFDNLTPVHPSRPLVLERADSENTRLIDLFAPMGLGQRGMVFAPPRSGGTRLMCGLAQAIKANHPDLDVLLCLVDERPEEVTELSRELDAEVIASTFDEPASRHLQVAEMVIERARRLVEHGQDVVVLLDSLTRLVRASNQVVTASGHQLSGGLDPAALQRPKRILGSARAVEEGGSLTLITTVLVDSGSALDRAIAESLQGIANQEIHLLPSVVAGQPPSLDLGRCHTRRAELLQDPKDQQGLALLRAGLTGQALDDLDWIRKAMSQHPDNRELLDKLPVTGQ